MPSTSLSSIQIVSKSSTYTANYYDTLAQLDATSASFTVNLPTAASMNGTTLTFKRTDSVSANTITVDAFGSETINGSTTFVLIAQDQTLQITSDGTNWIISAPVRINAVAYVNAPAGFSTASLSYVNVNGAQYATKTLSGGAQNPGTANDMAMKVAFLPKGTYSVICYGSWGQNGAGFSINARIFDGTTQIGQGAEGNSPGSAASTFGGLVTYATDQTNITFTAQLHTANAGVSAVLGAFNGSGVPDVSIVLTKLS